MSTTVRELARQRPVEVTPGVSLQGGMLTLSDSGQGIHVAGAADLNFSGDCCIEWFGRITAMSSNGHLLVGQGETLWNGTDVAGYYFTYSPNNKLYAWAMGNLAARAGCDGRKCRTPPVWAGGVRHFGARWLPVLAASSLG